MYRVQTVNKISEAGQKRLTEQGYSVSAEEESPDAILVRSADLRERVFNPELLCIARAGAGVNNIPLELCANEGIVVFNTPGANAEAVAELAICSLLLASRDVLGGIDWVRETSEADGDVSKLIEREKGRFTGPEIFGKTLGVIGLGAVGARTANAALALGMKVYGYDPYMSVETAWKLSQNVHNARNLETIYRNCDYITLHVPLSDDTREMINAETIAKMRDGIRVVNLSRGELVRDRDMIAALNSGKAARYVTDFPTPDLIGTANVIPLPHLGASTPESEENCANMAAEELIEYLENGNIYNSVNFPSVVLERMGVSRLCVIHRNRPGMIKNMLEQISRRDINVEHMTNKPSGDLAYTVIDTGSEIDNEILRGITSIEDVLRARVI